MEIIAGTPTRAQAYPKLRARVHIGVDSSSEGECRWRLLREMSVGADLVFLTGKFRLIQERILAGCGILERVPLNA